QQPPTTYARPMTTAYSWRLLRAGAFRLDGGSMFGLIPRAVWSRAVPPDDRGRIPVQHNCLLLDRQRQGDTPPPDPSGPPAPPGPPGPAAPRRTVREPGPGNTREKKPRDISPLKTPPITDPPRGAGPGRKPTAPAVPPPLPSAPGGGLPRLCRAGESPDWT